MSTSQQVTQFATRRLARRLSRSVPFVGSLIAAFTLAGAIRRKGVLGGAVDTLLDFTPFVGAVKNVMEVRRGRDFIRDRTARA
jgi:hypothetical protein